MNYKAHYDHLISRARGRLLQGYRERHHVIPRCMGGGNDSMNIVELTAEEHYVAHQLLVKIYPLNKGLVFAAIRQARNCKGNKAYGWIKRKLAISKLGHRVSLEARAKMSASSKGKPKSAEHRAKIAAAILGTKKPPRSAEARANQSAAQRGRKMKPRSPEHCAKISAKAMGNKRCLGIKHTLETRAKISAARKGVKLSIDHIARLREGHRLYFLRLKDERT